MIEVVDLSFGYRAPDDLFQGFSLRAERGETWAILGPSGCGKTTLLHLLAGLRRPSSGQIRVGGQLVSDPRKSTGLILQDHGLLPWATAEDNVGLGLRIRGVDARRRAEVVARWMEALGISDVRRQYPWQLSGGQRQRVAIARALVLEPETLLMDEPFASLDALTREDMQELLVDLTLRAGPTRPTIALVTHDVGEAVLLGQKVMVLSGPPITRGHVLDNPLAGTPGFRLRTEFHETCLAVRSLVERARLEARRGAPAQARPPSNPTPAASSAGDSARARATTSGRDSLVDGVEPDAANGPAPDRAARIAT